MFGLMTRCLQTMCETAKQCMALSDLLVGTSNHPFSDRRHDHIGLRTGAENPQAEDQIPIDVPPRFQDREVSPPLHRHGARFPPPEHAEAIPPFGQDDGYRGHRARYYDNAYGLCPNMLAYASQYSSCEAKMTATVRASLSAMILEVFVLLTAIDAIFPGCKMKYILAAVHVSFRSYVHHFSYPSIICGSGMQTEWFLF